MSTSVAPTSQQTVTAPDTTGIGPDDWELDITITDAPRPAVANCDTNDTCESTCDSSCASD
ncbi:FxLD family lanthipeptide [Streptomyces sp. NBC_00237]|uniref:FxLD family lanthipeptide n=1 Tax=Streptomyces sp. NBC_00237 TaxID=2975687 RepID=UPI0022523957|nr:FxLD family lanthipeptide [Streptomyces sp. NBC_00237]MCX5206028.1 FxLD family lanthipeptide [Streptomyces sp. NBC_00237]